MASHRAVYHLDLKTHQVTKLPGSEGLFAPFLSRDGRYVTASLRFGQPDQKLMLFDFKKRKWEELAAVQAHYREWSHDSRYLYFDNSFEKVPAVYRVRISDHKVERVVKLEEFHPLGVYGGAWFGLAPDDTILVARDLSSMEIHALDWEAP
jgi:Tol biopolymer transport system component